MGGWVVLIKVKANLSSTGTGLPTGTELGKRAIKEGMIWKGTNPVYFSKTSDVS